MNEGRGKQVMTDSKKRKFLNRHGLAIFLLVLAIVLFFLFSGYPTS